MRLGVSTFPVIPAQAGIQSHVGPHSATLDPRLRGDDEPYD
jgi:hypothetical protein